MEKRACASCMAFSLKTTYLSGEFHGHPWPPVNKTIEFSSRESILGVWCSVQVNSEVRGQFPQPPPASKQKIMKIWMLMLFVPQITVTPCRMKTKQTETKEPSSPIHLPPFQRNLQGKMAVKDLQFQHVPTIKPRLTEPTHQGTQSSNLDLVPTIDLPT